MIPFINGLRDWVSVLRSRWIKLGRQIPSNPADWLTDVETPEELARLQHSVGDDVIEELVIRADTVDETAASLMSLLLPQTAPAPAAAGGPTPTVVSSKPLPPRRDLTPSMAVSIMKDIPVSSTVAMAKASTKRRNRKEISLPLKSPSLSPSAVEVRQASAVPPRPFVILKRGERI